MKVKLCYPTPGKKALQRREFLHIVRWPVCFAVYFCPILNLCLGGPAWSVVVVWSLFMAWTLALSPDLVEYNRVSQSIKLVVGSCILLILIDVLLSPGWAVAVVPIVCFSGLILAGTLFFTDLERQKQNMLPLLLLCFVSILCSVGGIILWNARDHWGLVVLGALALALLIACAIALGGELPRELRRRFHTK